MSELEQIAAVLRSLGIQVKQITFHETSISFGLSWKGKRILRTFTHEQIRSGLVIKPAAPPAAPSEQKRGLKSIISRTLTR